MARIRSVHPSLFTDEAWVSCSPLARLLYIGLMCDADDQGLFEWKPLQIKMRLLPGDPAEVPALLAELVAVNLIAQLEAGGKRLGAIRYFRRFQRPKKPNALFVLPPEWRTYVGLTVDGADHDDDDGDGVRNQFPTGGEKLQQMEDGGGVGKGEADASPAGKPDEGEPPKGKTAKRKPETPIPDGYPDAAAIAEAQAKFRAEGCDLDAARQAERFRNHALQTDRRCRDWRAAWRNWALKTAEEAPKRPGATPAKPARKWSGPDWVRQVMRQLFDAKGDGYLDAYCAWQDVPTKALLVSNDHMATMIRQRGISEFEKREATVIVSKAVA